MLVHSKCKHIRWKEKTPNHIVPNISYWILDKAKLKTKNHMQILVLGSQGNDAKKSGDALQSPTEMDKVTMDAVVLFMLRLRGPNP